MHTKGPWKVYQYDNKVQIDGIGRKSVCTIHSNNEEKANARLIAAAPELLEALEDASAAIDEVGLGGNDHAYHRSVTKVVAEAIRKAKGE